MVIWSSRICKDRKRAFCVGFDIDRTIVAGFWWDADAVMNVVSSIYRERVAMALLAVVVLRTGSESGTVGSSRVRGLQVYEGNDAPLMILPRLLAERDCMNEWPKNQLQQHDEANHSSLEDPYCYSLLFLSSLSSWRRLVRGHTLTLAGGTHGSSRNIDKEQRNYIRHTLAKAEGRCVIRHDRNSHERREYVLAM